MACVAELENVRCGSSSHMNREVKCEVCCHFVKGWQLTMVNTHKKNVFMSAREDTVSGDVCILITLSVRNIPNKLWRTVIF